MGPGPEPRWGLPGALLNRLIGGRRAHRASWTTVDVHVQGSDGLLVGHVTFEADSGDPAGTLTWYYTGPPISGDQNAYFVRSAGVSPVPTFVGVDATASPRLLRKGAEYYVKGAGGYGVKRDQYDYPTILAERLARHGVNSIRTWGTDRLKGIMDEAVAHDMTVMAGIWVCSPESAGVCVWFSTKAERGWPSAESLGVWGAHRWSG